jgi:hypothetical protein
MRLAYFPNQIAQNGAPVLTAFLDSCHIAGIDLAEEAWDADVAVIWSVLWAGRMSKNQQVYQHYRQQNKPVIVIDIGALYRGTTWKIAVNNITANGYYGHQHDLDWDRPKKLQISLGHTIQGNSSVLIAAQHVKSLQVANLQSVEAWISEQIAKIQQYTDRPIVVRPHPRSRLDVKLLPPGVTIETPRHIVSTYDSFNLKFDYQALINYNSGPGIQAAIEGCPVIVDSSSLAYPVSIAYDQIENRPVIDRYQWLVELTHTEYTLEEIKQAKWLKRIQSALH